MDKYWIWFKILDIEYIKKKNLLKEYLDVKKIYYLNTEILKKRFKFNKKEINNFINKEIRDRAEKINIYNNSNGIKIISILDEDYPYLLKQIYNPPILLYYKGRKDLLKTKMIGIFIGKSIDNYGINIIDRLCNKLYNENIAIITRYEKVDNYIYKYENNNIIILAEGINNKIKFDNTKGIILSTYEYDVIKSKDNILERNLIFTGLSKETIILQANIIDGANYIVDSALDNGREISVFPGDVFNNNNLYTNSIIKQGANVISEINDLLVYEQTQEYVN